MTSAIVSAPSKVIGAGERYLINGYDRYNDDIDFDYCCDKFEYEYSYSYSYTYKYKYEYSYTYKNHCGTTA